MTQTFTSLVGCFPRPRVRSMASLAKRTWSIGGARTNPELRDLAQSANLLDQWLTALRNRSVRRRWQRELRALDDRQLSDIGVSRADVERTVGRMRFWI